MPRNSRAPIDPEAMRRHAGEAARLLKALGNEKRLQLLCLLVDGERAWKDSDAIRRVVGGLGGAWRIAHALALLPRGLRDRVYRLVARNRYRWFGRNETCFLPTPEQRARFVE